MYKYTDQKESEKNSKGEKSLCKSALGQYRQYADDISIERKYLKYLIWHIHQ